MAGLVVCAATLMFITQPAGASLAPISVTGSQVSAKAAPVCEALYQDLNLTSGGITKGALAQFWKASDCDGSASNDGGKSVTFNGACVYLNAVAAYSGQDASAKAGQTVTGLTPASAKQMATTVQGQMDSLGCNIASSTASKATDSVASIKKAIDGLEFYALAACIAVVMISSAMWAAGSKGQNPGQEMAGKRGIITALTAAVFIGALPGLMNFVDNKAKEADPVGVLTSGFPTVNQVSGKASPNGSCTIGNQGKSNTCGGS
jgi:hypothetical protein